MRQQGHDRLRQLLKADDQHLVDEFAFARECLGIKEPQRNRGSNEVARQPGLQPLDTVVVAIAALARRIQPENRGIGIVGQHKARGRKVLPQQLLALRCVVVQISFGAREVAPQDA